MAAAASPGPPGEPERPTGPHPPARPRRDGGPVRTLRDRGLVVSAATTAYVVAALLLLGGLVWSAVDGAGRRALSRALADQSAPLAVLALAAVAGLFLISGRTIGRYILTARRMSADLRIITGANAAHRIEPGGPAELRELAGEVNALSDRRSAAERAVAHRVEQAGRALEQERNRLAALMSELTTAVVVCNVEGRILLYNAAARGLVDDDAAVGLGRSVFGIVDRAALTHALNRLADDGRDSHIVTAARGEQVLKVHLAPVREAGGGISGLVLVLEDLTEAARLTGAREALLRALSATTRSSVANIRAAVETTLDYPDMDDAERIRFLEIILAESRRLGDRLEGWFDGSATGPAPEWLPMDMQADDLLALVGAELEGSGLTTRCDPATEPGYAQAWLRVDSHALASAAVHLAGRAARDLHADRFVLALGGSGRHVSVDLRWDGASVDGETFGRWVAEPLPGGQGVSVHDVVDRHGGELWSSADLDGHPGVRVLLPVPTEVSRVVRRVIPAVSSRPEFYDFDLFAAAPASTGWRERRLDEVTFTVFDTETTGLDPNGGDEIISVGAVRVVNGRLLHEETFERLLDPGRSVPEASVAVHGITAQMLAGQPGAEVVLPEFARWVHDTVLVGHNVGFDMRFLKLKEARTGVRFTQPVLDTLLLDAALHPDHDDHRLEAIAERLGVSVVGRHTALGDALVTGEVFLGMLTLLRERGITTLGAAVDAARATYLARVDEIYEV